MKKLTLTEAFLGENAEFFNQDFDAPQLKEQAEGIPEDLNFDRFANELKYDDLDLEIEAEFGGEPVADGKPMWAPITYAPEYTNTGILDNYTYWVDSCDNWYERLVALAAKILNVKPEELTQEMINSLDAKDFHEWELEEFRPDVEEYALENWDYDDVAWRDLDDDYPEPPDFYWNED